MNGFLPYLYLHIHNISYIACHSSSVLVYLASVSWSYLADQGVICFIKGRGALYFFANTRWVYIPEWVYLWVCSLSFVCGLQLENFCSFNTAFLALFILDLALYYIWYMFVVNSSTVPVLMYGRSCVVVTGRLCLTAGMIVN